MIVSLSGKSQSGSSRSDPSRSGQSQSGSSLPALPSPGLAVADGWRGQVSACLFVAMFVAAVGGATAECEAQVLVNRDDQARSITVMAKSVRRRMDVGAGETLRDFCADGCVVRVDGDEARDFLIEGNEQLSIEQGLIYFDGEIIKKDDEGAAAEPGAPGEGAGGGEEKPN